MASPAARRDAKKISILLEILKKYLKKHRMEFLIWQRL